MVPSFKNTASIFPEISFIKYFPLFSCKQYDVFTDLICIIEKVNIFFFLVLQHSIENHSNLVALKLDPSNVNILLDKAALCYQMGDLKKALECYEAALKVIKSCRSR